MFKKIVAGTLVLVVLSTSGTVIYANGDNSIDGETKEVSVQLSKEDIKLIKPELKDSGEIIQDQETLLISVQILTEASVTMNVYKTASEADELIFEEESINEKSAFDTYSTELKDIKPGDYKISFKKEKEDEPFKIIEFSVKKELPADITKKSITDLLLGK